MFIVSNTLHLGHEKRPLGDNCPKISFTLKLSISIFCLRAGELLLTALGLLDKPRSLLRGVLLVATNSTGIPRHVGGTSVGSILSKACCSCVFSVLRLY